MLRKIESSVFSSHFYIFSILILDDQHYQRHKSSPCNFAIFCTALTMHSNNLIVVSCLLNINKNTLSCRFILPKLLCHKLIKVHRSQFHRCSLLNIEMIDAVKDYLAPKRFGTVAYICVIVHMGVPGGGGGGAEGPPPVCWANKASRAIFASQSANIGLL